MRPRALLLGLFILALVQPAAGQNLNQSITFGDSNVDSGFYKALPSPGGGANFNAAWAAAVAAGAGKPTSSPGLMNSEVLAAYFGLTALPSNQPGGTNYATSGAKNVMVNTPATGGFQEAIPTTLQMAKYLFDNGVANPNALFLINSGANDIAFANNTMTKADGITFLVDSAQSLATAIAGLKNAGARYFVVPNQPFEFPGGGGAGNANLRELRLEYSQALWGSLAAAGVNFIPADINSVRVAIRDNPTSFGFQFIDTADNHTTCVRPPGIGDAYALLCSSNPAAPSQYAAVPNPDQNSVVCRRGGSSVHGGPEDHGRLLLQPGRRAEPDLVFAGDGGEDAGRLIANIQQQIDAGRQDTGPSMFRAWVTGDTSYLQMDSYHGFPDQAGQPQALAAGIGIANGPFIAGGAISFGQLDSDFGGGRGSFKQEEIAGSLYAGFLPYPFWGTLVGTYGKLDYDVNRLVPIGITTQSNLGTTDGTSLSAAAQFGLAFGGCTKAGPFAGLAWQRVEVEGFTESGGFTSLSFADQTRQSTVGTVGAKLTTHCGAFRPFGQVSYSQELASTDREVTASLTNPDAPSYHMPAVELGKNWGSATLGAHFIFTPNVRLFGALSADLGQSDVVTYGAQAGINVSF